MVYVLIFTKNVHSLFNVLKMIFSCVPYVFQISNCKSKIIQMTNDESESKKYHFYLFSNINIKVIVVLILITTILVETT